jgi:hypothetical protein
MRRRGGIPVGGRRLCAATPRDLPHYFHDMVAKAILFEQARKLIQRWNPGADAHGPR